MNEFLNKHISALAIFAIMALSTIAGVVAINNNTAVEFAAQTTKIDLKLLVTTIKEFFSIDAQRAIINGNINKIKDDIKKFWIQTKTLTKAKDFLSFNKLEIANFRKAFFERKGPILGKDFFKKVFNESPTNCTASFTQINNPRALIEQIIFSATPAGKAIQDLEYIKDPNLRQLAQVAANVALAQVGLKYQPVNANLLDSIDCFVATKTNIQIPDIKKFGSVYETLLAGAKSTIATVKSEFNTAITTIIDTVKTFIATFIPRLYGVLISFASQSLIALIGGDYKDSAGKEIVLLPGEVI
jgi:hypothetical protein